MSTQRNRIFPAFPPRPVSRVRRARGGTPHCEAGRAAHLLAKAGGRACIFELASTVRPIAPQNKDNGEAAKSAKVTRSIQESAHRIFSRWTVEGKRKGSGRVREGEGEPPGALCGSPSPSCIAPLLFLICILIASRNVPVIDNRGSSRMGNSLK